MNTNENRDTIDWMKLENRMRATPLDFLRQGIRTQDWGPIKLCYTLLTGESVESKPQPMPVFPQFNPVSSGVPPTIVDQPVKRKRGRPRKNPLPEPAAPPSEMQQPKLIIPGAGALADCVAPAQTPESRMKNGKLFARSVRHDTSPHPNTFVDDLSVATNEAVKDRVVPDSILNNHRPAVNPVKKRCADCGNVYDVDPSLLPYGLRLPGNYTMKWRCNSCVCGGARGAEADSNAIGDELYNPEDERL